MKYYENVHKDLFKRQNNRLLNEILFNSNSDQKVLLAENENDFDNADLTATNKIGEKRNIELTIVTDQNLLDFKFIDPILKKIGENVKGRIVDYYKNSFINRKINMVNCDFCIINFQQNMFVDYRSSKKTDAFPEKVWDDLYKIVKNSFSKVNPEIIKKMRFNIDYYFNLKYYEEHKFFIHSENLNDLFDIRINWYNNQPTDFNKIADKIIKDKIKKKKNYHDKNNAVLSIWIPHHNYLPFWIQILKGKILKQSWESKFYKILVWDCFNKELIIFIQKGGFIKKPISLGV